MFSNGGKSGLTGKFSKLSVTVTVSVWPQRICKKKPTKNPTKNPPLHCSTGVLCSHIFLTFDQWIATDIGASGLQCVKFILGSKHHWAYKVLFQDRNITGLMNYLFQDQNMTGLIFFPAQFKNPCARSFCVESRNIQKCTLTWSENCDFLFLFLYIIDIVPWGKFGSLYLTKAQQLQE